MRRRARQAVRRARMKTDSTVLRSKFARRIVALLVIAALIPIAVTAVLSLQSRARGAARRRLTKVLVPATAVALLVVALLSIRGVRRTLSPLEKLIDGTRRAGNQDFLRAPRRRRARRAGDVVQLDGLAAGEAVLRAGHARRDRRRDPVAARARPRCRHRRAGGCARSSRRTSSASRSSTATLRRGCASSRATRPATARSSTSSRRARRRTPRRSRCSPSGHWIDRAHGACLRISRRWRSSAPRRCWCSRSCRRAPFVGAVVLGLQRRSCADRRRACAREDARRPRRRGLRDGGKAMNSSTTRPTTMR